MFSVGFFIMDSFYKFFKKTPQFKAVLQNFLKGLHFWMGQPLACRQKR